MPSFLYQSMIYSSRFLTSLICSLIFPKKESISSCVLNSVNFGYGYGVLKRQLIRFLATVRKNKIKYVINHGGNVIIFPEGYWNIADDGEKDDVHGADGHNSDSWLVQDLNIGVFRNKT